VLRSVDALPKQGMTLPWRLHQNYLRDIPLLRRGPVDDAMDFAPAGAARPSERREPASVAA
jgi:monooxygenase